MGRADQHLISDLSEARNLDRFRFRGSECDVNATIRSKVALVTFDNLATIDERPEDGEWKPWLSRYAEELDYSIIGIQSHNKDWYRNAETPAHLSRLVSDGFFERFDHILFTGTSMGGFGALIYAGLVPGARVLAFSPQSTLHRGIAPFEKRYPWPYRRFDWESPEYLDAADYVGKVAGGHIFYDPYVPEDRKHANRLSCPHLTEIKIPFSGHKVVRTIAKCGALKPLLQQLAENQTVDAGFWQLMRNRRQDPTWAKALVKRAAQRGDGPLLRGGMRQLSNDQGFRFLTRVERRLDKAANQAVPTKTEMASSWTDGLSEAEIRKRIPVFVNSYNQLTYLRDTVDWFHQQGFENVTVLDNQSSFPALLSYFDSPGFTSKARLIRLDDNLGPRKSLAHAAQSPETDEGFIFTDPDLTLPSPPADNMIKDMFEIGRRNDFIKVGLALSIDPDIIDIDKVTYNTRTVQQVERKYWKYAVEDQVYTATTDTTFFVYVPRESDKKRFNDYGLRQARIPSVRVGRDGFVAIHRPWLRRDEIDKAEEDFYFENTDNHSTYVVAQKKANNR